MISKTSIILLFVLVCAAIGSTVQSEKDEELPVEKRSKFTQINWCRYFTRALALQPFVEYI